jgi:hypothetical protein
MSKANEGINPAIIPIIKHQVASMVVYPVWIEILPTGLGNRNSQADLAIVRQ